MLSLTIGIGMSHKWACMGSLWWHAWSCWNLKAIIVYGIQVGSGGVATSKKKKKANQHERLSMAAHQTVRKLHIYTHLPAKEVYKKCTRSQLLNKLSYFRKKNIFEYLVAGSLILIIIATTNFELCTAALAKAVAGPGTRKGRWLSCLCVCMHACSMRSKNKCVAIKP